MLASMKLFTFFILAIDFEFFLLSHSLASFLDVMIQLYTFTQKWPHLFMTEETEAIKKQDFLMLYLTNLYACNNLFFISSYSGVLNILSPIRDLSIHTYFSYTFPTLSYILHYYCIFFLYFILSPCIYLFSTHF